MTRAAQRGIPSLNNLRKQIFASTNDGQLATLQNWVAWGQALKHPESLINFIAAYGTHSSIMTLDPDGVGPILAGDLKARRIAADQLVNGTVLPGADNDFGLNCERSRRLRSAPTTSTRRPTLATSSSARARRGRMSAAPRGPVSTTSICGSAASQS